MNRPIPFLLTSLALCLAGCGGGVDGSSSGAPLTISAIGGKAERADPSREPLDMPQRLMMDATAQGLVRFDAAGQIVPGLAERWIVIDDGRSYIFRLREAEWPDGTAVTAEEVVRTLRRAAADGSRNDLAPFLAVIGEIVEMTPQVIEVRLKRPRPDLLKLFAQPELAVFRARSFEGSGPFRVRTIDRAGALLRLAPDPAKLTESGDVSIAPRAEVRLLGDRAALALARFVDGKADGVLGGSFVDWPLLAYAGIDAQRIEIDPAIGLFGLAVASHDGFLADVANRDAIAMSMDRAGIAQAVRPEWLPVDTILPGQLDSAAPPAAPAWRDIDFDTRVATARQRVDAWRRTHPGPLQLRVAMPSGPGASLAWAHIAASLLRIGIAPERVGADAREAELRLIDRVAPYDSGRWFVQTACIACSDQARALIEAGREAPDLGARAQRIAEADAALTADAAFIPIAQPLRWSIVTQRLNGWQRNTRAWHPLNKLRNDME